MSSLLRVFWDRAVLDLRHTFKQAPDACAGLAPVPVAGPKLAMLFLYAVSSRQLIFGYSSLVVKAARPTSSQSHQIFNKTKGNADEK